MELDHDSGMCSLPAAFKDQMTLDPNVSFKLVFGDPGEGIACDFDGIEKIHNFVAGDVIPRFTRFLT
jgi:hypothetical protein